MSKKTLLMGLTAVVAAFGLTFTGTTAAQAIQSFQIINVKKSTNQIGSQVIGSCLIRSAGGTCTITSGKSASRDIQLSLGVTRGAVASGLSIGAGGLISTTVACSSPALPANTSWKARKMGTKYSYQVRKSESAHGVVTTKTSGTLTAFNPYATRIACGTR